MTKVLTFVGNQEHELIEIGAQVRATYVDGTPVEGIVASRDWWFQQIMAYTVRELPKGRAYHDVPEYQIWPGRDAITVV